MMINIIYLATTYQLAFHTWLPVWLPELGRICFGCRCRLGDVRSNWTRNQSPWKEKLLIMIWFKSTVSLQSCSSFLICCSKNIFLANWILDEEIKSFESLKLIQFCILANLRFRKEEIISCSHKKLRWQKALAYCCCSTHLSLLFCAITWPSDG